eukprot:COSAG01_NODE_5377_length_4298_cov_2.455347_5_plen_84_part_00
MREAGRFPSSSPTHHDWKCKEFSVSWDDGLIKIHDRAQQRRSAQLLRLDAPGAEAADPLRLICGEPVSTLSFLLVQDQNPSSD